MFEIRLGISPINWINDDAPDLGDHYELETVFADMQRLGFTGTEMGRKYPRDPVRLKPLLARYGLVLTGAWKTVQFSSGWNSEEDFAQFCAHVQFLRQMDAQYAVVCDGGGSLHWDARGPRRTVERFDEAAWRRLADGLNRAGEYCRQFGIDLVYHPHFGTAIESPEEIDRLMSFTDPELVFLLADTGHIFAGGGQPHEVVDRHFERVRYIHLKDVREPVLEEARRTGISFIDAVRRGLFTVPGDGCIDFERVFSILRDRGYRGWMILEAEQDPEVADPVEYAAFAQRYLSRWLAE